MGSVGIPVIIRIAHVAQGSDTPAELLASVGLPPDAETAGWAGAAVDENAYYSLLERAAGPDDHGLPMRYGEAMRSEDLGALGLAMKTAPTVADALRRLERYSLVLSDTLEYDWVDERGGRAFALVGRPHHRRGAALANECALAALTSFIREAVGEALAPREVTFAHEAPPDDGPHRRYFGCPVVFDAPFDAVHLSDAQLARRTLLGDAGLSGYLLARLEELRAKTAERSLVEAVRGAVAEALPDGQPTRSQIARRLGVSERTLNRRLADHGESFQAVATQTRRDAAESLLRSATHSLAEVAFLTGFSDQSAFTRAFKRWTGVTPATFRADQA